MTKLPLLLTIAALVALPPLAIAGTGLTLEGHGAIGAIRVAYTGAYVSGFDNDQVWHLAFWGGTSGDCEALGSIESGLTCITPPNSLIIGGTGAPVTPVIDQHTVTIWQRSGSGSAAQTVLGG